MRVAVDGEALVGLRSGVGRYTIELFSAITRVSDEVDLTCVLPRTGQPLDEALSLVQSSWDGSAIVPGRVAWRVVRYGNLAGLPVPYRWIAGRQDLVFFPNFRTYATGEAAGVVVIHDLTFARFPQTIEPSYLRRLRLYVQRAIRDSEAIATVSETMKDEIERAYPEARNKTILLPPGPSTELERLSNDWREHLRALGLEPGYLLFVGNVEPRKNLGGLLEAVGLLPSDVTQEEPCLVLVGPPGWRNEAIQQRLVSLGDRVRRLGYQSDAVLRSLYEGAAAVVLPSYYEGFGLPILEAMRAGTPVLCSDIAVFREVARGAATYFDPYDPEDIATTLATALTSDLVAQRTQGPQRAAEFSWDRTARRAVELFRSLCGP